MTFVDVFDAAKSLSKLVAAVESGESSEIILTRDGRPAARLVSLESKQRGILLGVAKGEFVVPDDIDRDNEEIAKLFHGEEES